jgi:hypothetical protein
MSGAGYEEALGLTWKIRDDISLGFFFLLALNFVRSPFGTQF